MRAVDVLKRCDVVACEDTRVTGKLLKHLGISKPLVRYDDHSEGRSREKLLQHMREEAVVLVSDAGTPLISDPGYRLVRDAREEGLPITTLPGACAAIAGLTVSGLPNDRFLFAGFVPSKEKARADFLGSLSDIDATLIVYETGPRLTKTLTFLADHWPNREVAVARELTKLHEECRSGPAAKLREHYEASPPRGEIVMLIGPPVEESVGEADADRLLVEALESQKASQAAAEVARKTGLDRKMLYARAMELRGK